MTSFAELKQAGVEVGSEIQLSDPAGGAPVSGRVVEVMEATEQVRVRTASGAVVTVDFGHSLVPKRDEKETA